MKTYRDVFLTEDGFARNEDGFEFRGMTRERKKLVQGVGVNDFPFQMKDKVGGVWKPYVVWKSMLCRTYDQKYHKHFPTYIGTEVDPSWQRFSGFLEWLLEQPFHAADFELDKDIVGRGKLYGPKDCVMVPRWTNSLTIDSGASRGDLPLGVHKHGSGFRAQVCFGGGSQLRKYFRTIEAAVEFYHTKKREYVDSRKQELDVIDLRLYPGIVRILEQRRKEG